MTSSITKIDLEDDNPVILDDPTIVTYHTSKIQMVQSLINGWLEDNPTGKIWREVAEFQLEPGKAKKSNKRFTPYTSICNKEKYFNSYDVFVPVHYGLCGLHNLPYLEE
jgi:hypothetical protein